MGLLKIVGKTKKAVTAKNSECVCCGKELRSGKSNICSRACAQFLAMSY